MNRPEYYSWAGINRVYVDGWRVGLPNKQFVAATVGECRGDNAIKIYPDGAGAKWFFKNQIHRVKPEPLPGFEETLYIEPVSNPAYDELFQVYLK